MAGGCTHRLTNPFLFFPTSLIFGALTIVTGIIGVVLGAEASRRYKKVNPRAEPLICASSLLAAAVCLYLALILAPTTLLASYVSEGPIGGGVRWGAMGWDGNSCLIKVHSVPGLYVHQVYQFFQVELVIPILQMSKLMLTTSYPARKGNNWDLSLSLSDSKVYPPSSWLML